MHKKFLQTSTSLACFAGMAMTCFWGGTVSCFAMDEYDVYQEVNRAVDHAVWAAERSREAKEEAEKEKRKQYAFKTRQFENTAEGYEFKQQYLEEQRKASFLRSEIETRKREKEEGSRKLLKFQRKIDRLSANSRELWLVWDEERNWRIWEHMIDKIPKHDQIPYDKNLFYTEKPSRSDRDDDPYNFIHPGYAAAPNENIEKTGLARRRLETIQEFMKLNKKNKVPDEIRKFQEYRQKMDTKYKKENKRKHRLLFPGKKEERCITS